VGVSALPDASNNSDDDASDIDLTQSYSSKFNTNNDDYYCIGAYPSTFSFNTIGNIDTGCSLSTTSVPDTDLTGIGNTEQNYNGEGNCRFAYDVIQTSDFFIIISSERSVTDTAGVYTLQLNLE
jgi:hypothetical protein